MGTHNRRTNVSQRKAFHASLGGSMLLFLLAVFTAVLSGIIIPRHFAVFAIIILVIVGFFLGFTATVVLVKWARIDEWLFHLIRFLR